MRLTDILFRMKPRLPRGHIWRGKFRLYKPVTESSLKQLKMRFEQEEKNMFYLRHPYLTYEQSHGHSEALGKRKEFIDNKKREKKWKDHSYLGDRLGFLKVADKWE